MNVELRVTYTSISAGQQRAYGDTIHEGVLEFSGAPEWNVKRFMSDTGRSAVEPYARLFCANWTHEGEPWGHVSKDSMDAFFTNHLVDLSMVEPGKWHVKVVYPYDD